MASKGMALGKRIAPPRFLMFMAIFVLASVVAASWLTAGRAAMVGFDIAASIFLLSLWPLFDSEVGAMRDHAEANAANRILLLAITGLVMIVILISVAVELAEKPGMPVVAVVIGTLAIAWLFSNTVYALHYAHLYYRSDDGNDMGGLDIPSCKEPDYWDFVYFSYTLGMTFQTSDVDLTSREMRRVATGHCLAAFAFNLGVIAFTINVLGG